MPYAAALRRDSGLVTQTVGLIRDPRHAEEILQAGAADLVAIGREALYDPFWAAHASQALGCDPGFATWPQHYGWWLDARARFLGAPGASPSATPAGDNHRQATGSPA